MIYEHEGLYGIRLVIDGKVIFMATDPTADALVIKEIHPGQARLAGVTWSDTVAPPVADEFSLRNWNEFLKDAVEDVYDELLETFEDDLIYDEERDLDVLPWNAAVHAAARRALIRYALASPWAQSWVGQEKAIQFANSRVSPDTVKMYHQLLYQTEVMGYDKHRKATFLASVVLKLLKLLNKYQKEEEHESAIRANGGKRRRR